MRSYTLCAVDTLPVGTIYTGKPYVLEVRGNEELDIFSLIDANPLFWHKTVAVSMPPSQVASVAVEDLS
jgi:hypothetical protein